MLGCCITCFFTKFLIKACYCGCVTRQISTLKVRWWQCIPSLLWFCIKTAKKWLQGIFHFFQSLQIQLGSEVWTTTLSEWFFFYDRLWNSQWFMFLHTYLFHMLGCCITCFFTEFLIKACDCGCVTRQISTLKVQWWQCIPSLLWFCIKNCKEVSTRYLPFLPIFASTARLRAMNYKINVILFDLFNGGKCTILKITFYISFIKLFLLWPAFLSNE